MKSYVEISVASLHITLYHTPMNLSRLIRQGLSYKTRYRSPQDSAAYQSFQITKKHALLPILPPEIWKKIIAFATRQSASGFNAVDLDDPCSLPNEKVGGSPEDDAGLFEDCKSMMRVSSQWHFDVNEILCGYLTIYTAEELIRLVGILENSPGYTGGTRKQLGVWTKRIDFKIQGSYSVPYVVRLLKCTPNLLVYHNKNGPADVMELCTPQEILDALVTYCSQSLRRVEWSSVGEVPHLEDVVKLCQGLPHLSTLRLVAVRGALSQQADNETLPPMILPRLTTLSLGAIPFNAVDGHPQQMLTWDLFLECLSFQSLQLPALVRFECDVFPYALKFFEVHGKKLLFFRTAASYAQNALPNALVLCPRLDTLVLAQGNRIASLPDSHSSLRRILIVSEAEISYAYGVVPSSAFYDEAVPPLTHLLWSIQNMTRPSLSEVRVQRNMLAYSTGKSYNTWLGIWWRAWHKQWPRMKFCDDAGKPFQNDRESSTSHLVVPLFEASSLMCPL